MLAGRGVLRRAAPQRLLCSAGAFDLEQVKHSTYFFS